VSCKRRKKTEIDLLQNGEKFGPAIGTEAKILRNTRRLQRDALGAAS
jgi:hypothetical protein